MNYAKLGGGLSAAGLLLIVAFEGFSPTPYKDSVGIWTDGFGNTNQVTPGKPVSVPQALKQLERNTSVAGKAVTRCVNAEMTQGQYDAFVSFAFNVGEGNFCRSTMAKKANKGDLVGSCNEFDKWVYAGGKDCRIKANNCLGIVDRRKQEKATCLGVTQ